MNCGTLNIIIIIITIIAVIGVVYCPHHHHHHHHHECLSLFKVSAMKRTCSILFFQFVSKLLQIICPKMAKLAQLKPIHFKAWTMFLRFDGCGYEKQMSFFIQQHTLFCILFSQYITPHLLNLNCSLKSLTDLNPVLQCHSQCPQQPLSLMNPKAFSPFTQVVVWHSLPHDFIAWPRHQLWLVVQSAIRCR